MKFILTILFSIFSISMVSAQNSANDTLSAESLGKKMEKINKRVYDQLLPQIEVTRGTSGGPCTPCRNDAQNLISLWDAAIVAQKKCHYGKSTLYEVGSMMYRIDKIMNDTQCKWDDCPEMYLLLLIKWAEFDSAVQKYPCK